MKLPANPIISREKLTGYLLVKQARGDKSAFLALAGYSMENADRLLADLRQHAHQRDAVVVETNAYGRVLELRGMLKGPNGRELGVRTIWMTEHLSGLTKFITLIPDKDSRPA